MQAKLVMVESPKLIFWITAAFGPLIVLLNVAAIVEILRKRQGKRQIVFISLCITSITYTVFDILLLYYYSSDRDTPGRKMYIKILSSTPIPIYLSYMVHMFCFLFNQIWIISSGYRSPLLQERQVRIVMIVDLLLWFVPVLFCFLYIPYDIYVVQSFMFKYICLGINGLYTICVVTSCFYIVRKVHQSSKNLLEQSKRNIPGGHPAHLNNGKTEMKIIKRYFILVANNTIFLTTPMTIYGIVLIKSNTGHASTIVSMVTAIMIQVLALTCPLVYFIWFMPKWLKRLSFIDKFRTTEDSAFRINKYIRRPSAYGGTAAAHETSTMAARSIRR